MEGERRGKDGRNVRPKFLRTRSDDSITEGYHQAYGTLGRFYGTVDIMCPSIQMAQCPFKLGSSSNSLVRHTLRRDPWYTAFAFLASM